MLGQENDGEPIRVFRLRHLQVAHERPNERPIRRLHEHHPDAGQLSLDSVSEVLAFDGVQRNVNQLDFLAHHLPDLDGLNLARTLARVDALRPLVPAGMTMAQMALSFILSNPDVSTVIPGMRKARNVEENHRRQLCRPAASRAPIGAAQASLGPQAQEVEQVRVPDCA